MHRLLAPCGITLCLYLSLATANSASTSLEYNNASDSTFTEQESSPLKENLPAQEKLHLFLLVGQSNMAGRGDVAEVDRRAHPKVLSLNKHGHWEVAKDPIHFDKPTAGVGLGRSFALSISRQQPDIRIGLIPAACGGTSIDHWLEDKYYEPTQSFPYSDAIARAKLARKTGVLKGVLWHQGESDSFNGLAQQYAHRLKTLIAKFRTDLQDPQLPFIIGQLGEFQKHSKSPFALRLVTEAQRKVALDDPFARFVSSDQLTSKPDRRHFNAKSLREFGRRYATAYFDLNTALSLRSKMNYRAGRNEARKLELSNEGHGDDILKLRP